MNDAPIVVNPYVGPRAFEEGEGARFFGREREQEELFHLLLARRLVLLHAPSGAGKSSLVRAALIPRLRDEGFRVRPIIRVGLEASAGMGANRFRVATLLSLDEGRPPAERLTADELSTLSLSDYLARNPAPDDGEEVLIFDQFEELLSADPTDRAAKDGFVSEIGALLENSRRWALFVLREDYLGALKPFLLPIPTRLAATYRLDLLDPKQARQAMQGPARAMGGDFSDAAATRLVDDLRQTSVQRPDGSSETVLGQSIEPVQLQVVCYRLWERKTGGRGQGAGGGEPGAGSRGQGAGGGWQEAGSRGQGAGEYVSPTISPEDLAEAGDVDTALRDYYAEQVATTASASGVDERRIRDWVEDNLITESGLRGQVLRAQDATGGLANTVIRRLVDAHLLRAEERRGVTWYELAHDRLIAPVRQDNAAWFEANLSTLQRQARLWDRANRPDGLLLLQRNVLTGAEKENGAPTHAAHMTDVERDFIQACRHAQKTAQRKRQWSLLFVIILVALILGLMKIVTDMAEMTAMKSGRATAEAGQNLALSAFANEQTARAQAQTEKQIADDLARFANAQALVIQSQAALTRDPEFSMLVALKAMTYSMNPQVADALRETVFAFPLAATLHQQPTQPEPVVRWLAFDRQTRHCAVGNAAGDVLIWSYDPQSDQWNDQPTVLHGHTGAVTAGAFSPDGTQLATASADGTVRVWDIASGTIRLVITHKAPLVVVQFSPNGLQVLTASNDGAVRLFHAADGVELYQFDTRSQGAIYATFTPDGQRVFTASTDGGTRLFDVTTGSQVFAFTDRSEPITDMDVSNDGQFFVTTSRDGNAQIFDSVQERSGAVLPHVAPLTSGRFSPDGRLLLTASEDGTARLFDVATGNLVRVFAGHTGPITMANFSPDGLAITTASADGTARIWDVATAHSLFVLPSNGGSQLSIAWDTSGQFLATGTDHGGVRIWRNMLTGIVDLRSAERVRPDHHAVSPDGLTIVAGYGAHIELRHSDAGVPTILLPQITTPLSTTVFSSDSQLLLTTDGTDTARVWDAATGTERAALRGHQGSVLNASFSANSTAVVTIGADSTVRVWNAQNGDQKFMPPPYQRPLSIAILSPDASMLLTVDDAVAQIWDIPGKKLVTELRGHTAAITGAAWSPDGKRLVTISADMTGRLWGGRGETTTVQIKGHTGTLTGATWSPDGQALVTTSLDGTARLWIFTHEEGIASPPKDIRILRHPATTITSVAFNATSQLLLTAGSDGLVRLWGRGSERSLAQLYSHEPGFTRVGFSQTGGMFTTGADGQVRFYRCPICGTDDEVWQRAKTIPARHLDPDEEKLLDGLITLPGERIPLALSTSTTPTSRPSSSLGLSPTSTLIPTLIYTSTPLVLPTAIEVTVESLLRSTVMPLPIQDTGNTGGNPGNGSGTDQGSQPARTTVVAEPTSTADSNPASTSPAYPIPARASPANSNPTANPNPAPTSPAYPNPTADSPAPANPAPANPAPANPAPANPSNPNPAPVSPAYP